MTWTVGLTGGIASGKTAVAALLIASGVPVLDADQAARDVVEPGTPALDAIIKHFGQDILTAEGALDRAALRTRVFHQPADRKVLESIVHPAVRTAMNDWRARQSAWSLFAASFARSSSRTRRISFTLWRAAWPRYARCSETAARSSIAADSFFCSLMTYRCNAESDLSHRPSALSE